MIKKILLIDDEPNILLSFKFLMKSAGNGVITAGITLTLLWGITIQEQAIPSFVQSGSGR